jgi:hypothetical protein
MMPILPQFIKTDCRREKVPSLFSRPSVTIHRRKDERLTSTHTEVD